MDFLLICLVSWLSAGHLGNSVSSGRFSSAYCGGLDVELRALGSLQLQAGSNRSAAWEKPALWMGWFTTRVFSCVCVCVCVCVHITRWIIKWEREWMSEGEEGGQNALLSLLWALEPLDLTWKRVIRKPQTTTTKRGARGRGESGCTWEIKIERN